MTTTKTFALADVKWTDTADPYGAFEAVLSAPTLDRDNEVIEAGAFDPLPKSVPVHAYHRFDEPIGVGVPAYEDGKLMLRGRFASTPRAQEIRTLVKEGVIGHMSVGFMSADRGSQDGVPRVTKAELLEGSFVSVPANREAAILTAKDYQAKAPSRGNKSDRLQMIHDLSVANGASCETKADADADDDGGKEQRSDQSPDQSPDVKASGDDPAPGEDELQVALLKARLAVIPLTIGEGNLP